MLGVRSHHVPSPLPPSREINPPSPDLTSLKTFPSLVSTKLTLSSQFFSQFFSPTASASAPSLLSASMETSSNPVNSDQVVVMDTTDETVSDMERRLDAEIAAACPGASDVAALSLSTTETLNLTIPSSPSIPTITLPSLLPSSPSKSNHRDNNSEKPKPDKTKPVPLMSIKTTYARAASKQKERVEYLLHVYSSKNKKSPISQCEWDYILEILIDLHTSQVLEGRINPKEVSVAHTGFDDKHHCGFIACRNEESAAWHKKAVETVTGSDGLVFRAWAKGDLPQVRLCRIYLPARFDRIPVDKVIPLIKAYNSELKESDISLKKADTLQGGRALFVEIDQDSYTHIRTKQYKLEFVLGDIDCHGVAVNPPPTAAPQGAQSTSDKAPPASDPRTGANAILPRNAITDFNKISKRDPRIKNTPPAQTEKDDDTDSISSCSTTSSRGSAKYKPPSRKRSPSQVRRIDSKSEAPSKDVKGRGLSNKPNLETESKSSPQKRGRDHSKDKRGNRISPGIPSSKRDKRK